MTSLWFALTEFMTSFRTKKLPIVSGILEIEQDKKKIDTSLLGRFPQESLKGLWKNYQWII